MDYAGAISKVLPGTFVPDLGSSQNADETPSVSPIPQSGDAGASGVASFKDTVKSFLDGVDDKMTVAQQNTQDLADGKTDDMNKVVSSVEEASLAFSFTMALRDKILQAYQQVNQMQV